MSLIERWKEVKLKKESKKARLERQIKKKGFKRTTEEFKRRVNAKAATVKRYTDRIKHVV